MWIYGAKVWIAVNVFWIIHFINCQKPHVQKSTNHDIFGNSSEIEMTNEFIVSNDNESSSMFNSTHDFYEIVQNQFLIKNENINQNTPKSRLQRQLPQSLLIPPAESLNDKPPSFIHPDCRPFGGVCADVEYTIQIQPGLVPGIQPLQISPKLIEAQDLEYNKAIIYKFVNGTPSNYETYFFMDPVSAAVSQVRPVPFGEVDNFTIYFMAKEAGALGLSSIAKLIIRVDNTIENLHDPVLEVSAMRGYIDENSEIGTVVRTGLEESAPPLQILVTDEDLQPGMPPATYQYILMGIGASVFAVNQGGYVYLNAPTLDADGPNPRTYALTIQAREVGTAPIRSSQPISIKIDVIDANDNDPTFERQVYQAQALSDTLIQDILKIQAKDGDYGKNGELHYSIVSVTNNGERYFRYNSDTGHLVSIAPLKQGDQYQILLQATDGGGKSGQAIIVVDVIAFITVTSTTETTPATTTNSIITRSVAAARPAMLPGPQSSIYNVTVSESVPIGSVIVRLGSDGREKLRYAILKGNDDHKFRLDTETGTIITVATLDHETTPFYQLIVQAIRHSANSTVTILLTVEDENDNAPTFTNVKPIVFFVDDGSAPGTIVGQMSAEDPDSGVNGAVKFFIDSDSPSATSFAIDPMDGSIRTKKALRASEKSVHYLRIIARDSGTIAQESNAEIEIRVVDKSNTLPFFINDNYLIEIDENVGPRELVKVEAKSEMGKGTVTYVLKQGDPTLFAVDSTTGSVSTLANLDAEQRRLHSLIIGTQENNEKSAGSIANIELRVKDINDWIPIFRPQSYAAAVPEAVKIGTPIMQVTAVDQDAEEPNNVIRFRLVGDDNYAQLFSIDSISGVISVKRPLKDIENKEINLTIEASDGGTPSLSSTATATIQMQRMTGDTSQDIVRPIVAPDEPRLLATVVTTTEAVVKVSAIREIKFSSSKFSASIAEGPDSIGFLQILQVENKPSNLLVIQCSILSGNYGGVFSITTNKDGDCELRLRAIVDRETVEKYFMNISVTAPGANGRHMVAFGQVSVDVLDMNDNAPRFVFDADSLSAYRAYFAALAPEKPAGTKLVTVQAVDADAEGNNRVVYSLDSTNSDSQYFHMNSHTGEITNSKMLPERGQLRGHKPYYEFRVVAKDSPTVGQPLTSSADVVVNLISDSNRFVMTIDGVQPAIVERYIPEMKKSLQSRIGECKVIGVESIRNESSVHSIDVIFYSIDPNTKTICRHDEFSMLFEKSNVDHIKGELSTWLNVRQLKQHTAIPDDQVLVAGIGNAGDDNSESTGLFSQNRWQAAEIGLVTLGGVIVIGAIVGILAMCYFWSRYKASKIAPIDRANLYSALPKYNALILPPSEKEYETQIMQLALPGERTLEKSAERNFNDDAIYSMHAGKLDIYSQRQIPSHVYIPPPDYPSNGCPNYVMNGPCAFIPGEMNGRRLTMPAPAQRKRNNDKKSTIL